MNKEQLIDMATELWHNLNESPIEYEEFLEVVNYIFKIFGDIN